ncbi:MAG: regulator [Gammaproteobacteria bacterium]|nr:regulator [Gammaproteobacteria bacterium]
MKFNHKTWALLVVLAGGFVVGGYLLGINQGTGAPPPAARAPLDEVDPAAPLPAGHPTLPPAGADAVPAAMPGANAGAGNQRFTHFRVGNRNVKGLMVEGNVAWIGTSGGVIRYDAGTDSHRIFDNQIPGILSNGVFHVSRLGDKIAVGTYGGGLSMYDPATEQWKNYNIPQGLADQFVYDVHKANNGDVWIATWSGVNRVRGGALDDSGSWQTFTMENTAGGLPNPWVYGLAEGLDGDMWFATEEGLALYRKGAWKNWKHGDGLGAPYELVRDAIQFTSDPAAASQHHAQQKAEQGIEDLKVAYNPNYIISLDVDRDGAVWCGTWGAGLARFDGKTWKNFTTADGLPANHIFMLHRDRSGRLWIGTSQGLARLNDDGASFTVMTTTDGLFANNVFSMAQSADGTLWVGSVGGVARIAGGE